MAAYIFVGAKFADFDSLEHCIREYEKENHVTFYKRDVRTIQNMSVRIARVKNKKQLSEERMEELKYYSMTYTCIYGGRKFTKTPSKKIPVKPRRNTKTFKQDCPARIRVLLSKDANYLRIESIDAVHNHIISEEINKKLPKQRKLAKEEEEKVTELLKLKVNRELLLQQIREETGKHVTKKDLYNIAKRHNIPSDKKAALIANQSGSRSVIEVDNLKVPVIDTRSMMAFAPQPEDTVGSNIEGAAMSELGSTVIEEAVVEDHMYEASTLSEIGEVQMPSVGSLREKETSPNEQAKLELLREVESRKLKIEEEKLLLKSTKIRLLEEQNQLIKQLIDKMK